MPAPEEKTNLLKCAYAAGHDKETCSCFCCKMWRSGFKLAHPKDGKSCDCKG